MQENLLDKVYHDESPIEPDPEPSTSQDSIPSGVPGTEDRGRGKGQGERVEGRGRGRGKKYAKTEHVVDSMPQPVPLVPPIVKSEMSTQTDSDFETYLELSEDEFDEYQRT